jgi:uncharacterized protein YjdB
MKPTNSQWIVYRRIVLAAAFLLFHSVSPKANAQSGITSHLPVQSATVLSPGTSINTGNLWASAGAGNISDEELQKGKIENASPKTNAEGKRRDNFTYFSQTSINSNQEVKNYNSGYEKHPELGVLYSDVPCTNCYELIGRRTATQKYFVMEGTDARQFALQSYKYPVHYKNAAGQWLTITGHLEKDATKSGVYNTKGRPVNITINTEEGYSTLSGINGDLTYNHDLELVYLKPDGTESSLGKADWHNYTAGDDGVRVINAWPGIDIEMSVLVNSLKTNFIVKAAMPAYAAGKLVLRDHVITGDGLSMNVPNGNAINGAIQVRGKSGAEAFIINPAIAYEHNAGEGELTELSYRCKSGRILDIEVPGSLLNKPSASYPLVVDPLVTGTLSSGFTYTSGTFPPAFTSTSEYCTNTNNVSIPAAATLSDIQITFNYYGPAGVSWGQSRLALQINGGCTYGWLSCSAAAFSSGIPGNTCGYLNQSFWSVAGAWGTTSGCVPAYSCTGYTLPFQLLTTQAQTSTAACAQTVYATASGFTVTVFGTTAMLPSISPSAAAILCMPATLALTGSPSGTWSSSAPAVGTVSTSGVVTGLTNGTTNITYTASGCTSYINLTVGTMPTVTGTPSICFPGSTTLTGTPGGGAWTSSITGVATVTGGVVTGVSIGTTIIMYNTGTCVAMTPVDVNSPTATAPTTQPSGFTVIGPSASGGVISFTPNSSTGYLVVATTVSTLSATPTTGTTYATGSAFGGGIVIQGSTSGSAPFYATTLLNSNTHYYIFVFAFNNNCAGPQYNITAPLTGDLITCVGPTSTPTIVSAGVNIINLSWSASPTGGGYIAPINYSVYAYTDAACTTLVPGYPVAAGTGTTYTATGLATGTQYWFRVSPADACAILSGIATGMTICTSAGSIPYLQTFEVATTLGDRSPNCMTSAVQNCVFSGVQTTVTYIGTINTNHTSGGTKFYNFFRGGACSAGWANQWLLLPGLAMTAGTTYTLSFWYRTDGAAWSSVQAQFSTVSTVPAVTSTSMGGTPGTIGPGLSGVSGTTYAQYIQTFTVPSSGTYYIGIDAASGGSAGLLAIDDIEVCAVPTVTATNSPAPYCLPDTVFLSSTGTSGAVTYDWAGPSGYSSTLTTPLPLLGLGAGTYTYTLTAVNDPVSAGFGGICTASATTTFTINNPPSAITGGTAICTGQTTTLSNTTSGGTWSSSTPTVGTVDASGVVMGIGAGTTTITYDVGGCYATLVVTVTAMPTAITGIMIACLGSTTTLSNSVSGGVWSSSNSNCTIATPSVGIITGAVLGTSVITYSMGGSCYVTAVVTVNPLPAAITGSFSICLGTTTTLGSATSGGIWTTTCVPAGAATINPISGLVSAIGLGTCTIKYQVAGCYVTQVITVVAAPSPIVGPSTVCVSYPTCTLTCLSAGGTWSASNINVSIDPSTGVVTGNVAGGTSTITYALSAGCVATKVMTVLPAPAAVTGTLSLCEGGSTTVLSHPVAGGTWSCACPGIATVGFGTGIVTSAGPGTCIVTYTLPTGCVALATVTVNANPAPITGTLSLCVSGTTTLSSATPGVTWSSLSTGIATVGATTGIVTGIAVGTATIVCTNGSGCQTTAVVTINAQPAPITGTATVCVGLTTTLSCTTPLGAWSSSVPAVGTISGAGVVTGITAGTTIITYATASGCFTTTIVTVNSSPAAITGSPVLCVGYTTLLACATPGGTWSSSNPLIAAVLSPGLIGGSAPGGTATISYTVSGCSSLQIVTVNALPGPISGILTVCVGATTPLVCGTPGGAWSSGSANATVDPFTGVVTGVNAGTAGITYTVGSGCITTAVVTVNAIPNPITGSLSICTGNTMTLSTTTPGCTWTSGNLLVATVGVGTGIVTGVAVGTATIVCYNPVGCQRSVIVTVNTLPSTITGGTNVCIGATTTLSATPAGGLWSSSNGNATVIAGTGVVTGVFAGTSILSYTLPSGCYRTTIVNVSPLPTGISAASGSLQVCVGSTNNLTGSPAGGAWLSSIPAIGTVSGGSGVLGGVSAGTTLITYTLPTGCALTVTATVNPLPAPITGVMTTCVGQTTALADVTPSGTWASSTPSIGTVDGAGVVYGISGGPGSATTTITYTIPTGCRTTTTVTVFALPGVITGNTNVCVAGTTTLNCTPSGGTWSMGCAFASVGVTTGIVTGAAMGTCNVTYTLGTGCTRVTSINVNPLPNPITGSLTTCVGQTTALANSSPSGTWSSNPTSVATVVSGTGVVTGVSGTLTATISYTLPTTCRITAEVTVYGLPSSIGGTLQVCEGSTTSLTTTTPGGTWASSNPAVGTIDAASGMLAGILAGTTDITYTLGTGCYKTAAATVNPLPAAITGTLQVCRFASTTLSNSTPLGTWSSSTPANATVTSGGVVTGVLPGTSVISYTLPTGCSQTAIVTVNSLPTAITGPGKVCVNSVITLSSTPPGGLWNSPHSTVAVNPVSGDVTGLLAGTATIYYTIGTGCVIGRDVTVDALPAAITGNPAICFGATTTLATISTGGAWSSTNLAVATIDAAGFVTSGIVGTSTISYTSLTTGCASTVNVTVNSLPTPITGSAGFCNLSSTTYMSSSTNGVWWSSLDTSILVIDSVTGVATGVTVDTTFIKVRDQITGCSVTKKVFLILAPYPVTGPTDVCLGQCVPLGNAISGGIWTSSNPAIAPIDPTGLVCGTSLGTTGITYVLSTGCFTSQVMTVNPIPVGIIGPSQICEASCATLGNATPGGTWQSSDLTILSCVSSTGVVCGVSAGTVTVTYALGTGCNAQFVMTVNPLPSLISGSFQVCEGLSTPLSSSPTGGLWSSADPSVADIDIATGLMTGISSMTTGVSGLGMTIITYSLPVTGCQRTQEVTVNPLPSLITGVTDICVNDVTTFANATPGGGWVSSNPVVGTIDGVTGVFTALSAGNTIISYLLPTSCVATHPLTVHDNPAPIGGSLSVCAGFATNLLSSPPGGSWSQDPMSIPYGTIHSITGVVSGVVAGLIPVTYTLPSGCRTVETVTVITLPAVISGPPQVCVDDSVILTNPVSGGTWSSSNPARATIDPVTGRVRGLSAGTAVMTYAVGTGCFNVLTMTVNPLPLPITGPLQVCGGSTILLSSGPTPGGNWISDNTTVANVGYVSGLVTGVSPGVSNISYSIGATGCLRSVQVTVNATPGPIVGNPHVCIGSSNLFTDTLAGGSWYSGNTSIATIGISSGLVTSVAVGTVIITYQYSATGCQATRVISVQPLPIIYNVTGGGNYCAGGNGVHIGLNGSQPGVSYVLYRGATAVGYMSGSGFALDFGLLTAAGTYTVQATNVTSGCMRNMTGSATVIVNPLVTPSVTIATVPSDTVCPGQTVTMTPLPVNGGTSPTYLWEVNGVSVISAGAYAYIPANGDVVTVTMGSNANCLAMLSATTSKTLTVLPNMMPVANVITSPNDTICQYNPVTFTAAPVYGGDAPIYNWILNGTAAGSGDSYTYVPVDGDIVKLEMVSNYRCRLATTVTSGDVALSVDSLLIPHVTVWPEPGLAVEIGKPITLHATVTDGGPLPRYQWKVNGHPVAGATTDVYTAVFNDYDSIACEIVSSGVCHNIGTSDWVFITTLVLGTHNHVGLSGDIRLVPNPNKGIFTIKGNLTNASDLDADIEITDMLGQKVYTGSARVKGGVLDEHIQLSNLLANGMYILTLRADAEQKVFHFVMEQ